MKHVKTVTIPATTRERLDHLQCDLCGAKSNPGSDHWPPAGEYGLNSTSVKHASGNAWPDSGGDKTTLRFDICPSCFETKLVPWFAAQGATPRVEEVDF